VPACCPLPYEREKMGFGPPVVLTCRCCRRIHARTHTDVSRLTCHAHESKKTGMESGIKMVLTSAIGSLEVKIRGKIACVGRPPSF
jgi:hypothetical protein